VDFYILYRNGVAGGEDQRAVLLTGGTCLHLWQACCCRQLSLVATVDMVLCW